VCSSDLEKRGRDKGAWFFLSLLLGPLLAVLLLIAYPQEETAGEEKGARSGLSITHGTE
jgi:hypothetical protein